MHETNYSPLVNNNHSDIWESPEEKGIGYLQRNCHPFFYPSLMSLSFRTSELFLVRNIFMNKIQYPFNAIKI